MDKTNLFGINNTRLSMLHLSNDAKASLAKHVRQIDQIIEMSNI